MPQLRWWIAIGGTLSHRPWRGLAVAKVAAVNDSGQRIRGVGGRPARPRGDLPDGRQRPAGGADPRDDQLVAPLARGRRAAGRRPHRDRAGPDRPRRLGDPARRLLARRARGGDPRPAGGARDPQRDDRRPLARRRGGDAVLLAVPRPGRAPRADLERRAGAAGQPAAAARGASRRLARARARRAPARRRRDRRTRERARAARLRRRPSTSTRSRARCARSRARARGARSSRPCAA